MSDVLIKVDGVSKKFCRGLKKSLWYGMQDIGSELLGKRHGGKSELRPDEFWATNEVSFELRRGECLGLIGANGAGKSTLLKMLNGLIKPDKGRIELCGRIGALIELGAGFNPILSGRENIYINGSVLGFTKQEITHKFNDIVEFAEIGEFIDMPVQNYSSGMRVRLGFAVAAQMNPDVLIIDEVLAVGDIGFRVKCLNRIHELVKDSAVIFVSHSMPAVARICTHAMVMKKGNVVFSSPDVAEGIDAYYQDFAVGTKNVIVSGDLDVKAISISGQSADSMPVIPFGGNLDIDVDIKVRSGCKKIGMKIFISNQDLRPVVSIVTEDYQFFNWVNDSNTIKLRVSIPSLRLASGKHTVNVEMFDHEKMAILCRVENAATFCMGQHLSIGSDFFHAARWSIS